MIGKLMQSWTDEELRRVADAEQMVPYTFDGCLLTFKYGDEDRAVSAYEMCARGAPDELVVERFDALASRFGRYDGSGLVAPALLAMLQGRARHILASRSLVSVQSTVGAA